jgi:hypothetical protein
LFFICHRAILSSPSSLRTPLVAILLFKIFVIARKCFTTEAISPLSFILKHSFPCEASGSKSPC